MYYVNFIKLYKYYTKRDIIPVLGLTSKMECVSQKDKNG